MKWRKLGKLFSVENLSDLMVSHARIPILDTAHKDGVFDLYFGSRDASNRERIFKAELDMKTLSVGKVGNKPIIDFGENLGAFDDNGVTPCSLVNVGHKKYLYYCGWNIHVKIPFTCAIGLAVSEDAGATFTKQFPGAVLDRNRDDAQFVAVNDVLKDGELFKTWYLSCLRWDRGNQEGALKHFYNIKYATSLDGVDWQRKPDPVIDFESEFEYAISTPRVKKQSNGTYKMWYSYRGRQSPDDTYRIGYAESVDGETWVRKDRLMSSFDVSDTGWDSEMICYPFVFEYESQLYMLYNGNGYGRSGFGLAVLEADK